MSVNINGKVYLIKDKYTEYVYGITLDRDLAEEIREDLCNIMNHNHIVISEHDLLVKPS